MTLFFLELSLEVIQMISGASPGSQNHDPNNSDIDELGKVQCARS